MNKKSLTLLVATHLSACIIGFGAGIYALPILIAPPAPSDSDIQAMSSQSLFTGEFKKDLKDSDSFHWGEGKVAISSKHITFMGKLAPGPDYKLYLSPQFVETENDFNRLKDSMVLTGDVKTFDNFVVEIKNDIDPSQYNTVVIWCETFGEFITSTQYR